MKNIIILILFLCFVRLYSADDSKMWMSLSHEHEIYKNLFVEFEAEMRFENEMSTMYQMLLNFGFAYEFNEYFKISTDYRTRAYNYDELQDELLVAGYFEFDIIENLEFNTRLRYNKRWRDDRDNKEYIRPRFGLKYQQMKRVQPFIEIEGLYRINDNRPDRFDEVRYAIGLGFDLPNRINFDLYYGYHDEMNHKNLTDTHLLGIAWKFGNKL